MLRANRTFVLKILLEIPRLGPPQVTTRDAAVEAYLAEDSARQGLRGGLPMKGRPAPIRARRRAFASSLTSACAKWNHARRQDHGRDRRLLAGGHEGRTLRPPEAAERQPRRPASRHPTSGGSVFPGSSRTNGWRGAATRNGSENCHRGVVTIVDAERETLVRR